MNSAVTSKSSADIDHFIDITAEICPLTFVKTKLLIERMRPGEVAEVRLKGQEPLENVPRSVTDHGHAVLGLEPEDSGQGPFGVHRLTLRKK
jgi:tRNA 2-thiouridine synthesizing protein A